MDDQRRTWHLVQIGDGFSSGGAVPIDFLKRVHVEFYRPLLRKIKRIPRNQLSHAQRRRGVSLVREKIEPFFPGYAFVTFTEAGEAWREIFKIAGIRGLVCSNNLPVQVPWEMIEQIRAREIGGAIPAETELKELPWLVGHTVRVLDGPFAQFDGTVTGLPTVSEEQLAGMTLEELDESLRVTLLVNIFGRSTPVELSLTQISRPF